MSGEGRSIIPTDIIDLETLVSEAALNLFFYWNVVRDPENRTEWIAGLFERLLQYYDLMAKAVLDIGTVKETTISDNRGVIEGWRRKTLKTIKRASINPLLPKSYYEYNIKKMLARLLITHIPEAPSSRIAKCVSEILVHQLFNVRVNTETFRKEVKELKEALISQK